MSIYRHTDYRKIILMLTEERKKFDPKFNFTTLAESANIEKTYLSKVLKGDRELNSDQMYQVAVAFNLKAEETDYLLLLLEYVRTSVNSRRAQLFKKISAIQLQNRHISKHLKSTMIETPTTADSMSEYYFEPYVPIIHMVLSLRKYSKNIPSIATDLGISEYEFERCCNVLIKLKMIAKKSDGSVEVLKDSIHLPPNHPMFKMHHISARHINTHQLFRVDPSERVNFNMTFTANENTRRHIHELFLTFLRSAETAIEASPEDNVFQMGFELFPWLTKK